MGRRKKAVEEAPKPEMNVAVAENSSVNVSPVPAENAAVNVLAQIVSVPEQKN